MQIFLLPLQNRLYPHPPHPLDQHLTHQAIILAKLLKLCHLKGSSTSKKPYVRPSISQAHEASSNPALSSPMKSSSRSSALKVPSVNPSTTPAHVP